MNNSQGCIVQWDKLKTFYYVAKFENFTKTGSHLNISQSAVSRQIIDLEYQIGHQLFKRASRGLVLTRHGQLLFHNVEKMFMFAELGLTQIQNEQLEPQGDLSIGANVGLVETWLYPLIPDFLKQYPKVNLSIFSKDGQLDVESLEVHVALQPYTHDKPMLIQNLLTTWNRKLYASKEYIQKYGMPQTVADLEHHSLIGFGTETIHLFDNINWHLNLSQKKAPQKPYISANSLRAIFHYGNSGLGIISFSQESPLLHNSQLIEVLPELSGPNFDIYFTYPVQLKGIKAIDALEEYLHVYVQNHHKKYLPPPYLSEDLSNYNKLRKEPHI